MDAQGPSVHNMKISSGETLDDIEGADPVAGKATSILDATVRVHRHTPIERLGTEALRFLLDAGDCSGVLLRLAIDRLERDPFQGGDFYPGDLLVAVLRQPSAVWLPAPDLRARAFALIEDAGNLVELLEPEDRSIVERSFRDFKACWMNGGANR